MKLNTALNFKWKNCSKRDFEWSHSLFLKTQSLRGLWSFIEFIGHYGAWAIGITISYFLCGCSNQCKRCLQIWLNLIVVTSFCQSINILLKVLFRRKRPIYNGDDMFALTIIESFSFPSGHSTHAASVAYFFARYVCQTALQQYIAVMLAWFVGLSRVFLGRHYILDVVVGHLIGFAGSKFLETYGFKDYYSGFRKTNHWFCYTNTTTTLLSVTTPYH